MKKALFLFKNIDEINESIKFLKVFKNKYPFVEVDALYVRDVMKFDIFPTTIEGVGIQGTINQQLQEYKAQENINFTTLEEKVEDFFNKVYSKSGETVEIALEEMKAYDLFIVVKHETLSSTFKDLIRYHYKPMIILSKTPADYEYTFEKKVFLNNGGYQANKAIYSYFNNFDVKNIDVLRVNVEEVDRLHERFGDICNIIDKIGDEQKIILEEIQKYDLIIMGTLKFSVFFEKLAGSIGIKIVEGTNKVIYLY